jgi:hypothetical protein
MKNYNYCNYYVLQILLKMSVTRNTVHVNEMTISLIDIQKFRNGLLSL